MKVVIDHDRCTGHGRCTALAPEFFVEDDAGQGQVIGDGDVPADLEDAARRAVKSCPERAIMLE